MNILLSYGHNKEKLQQKLNAQKCIMLFNLLLFAPLKIEHCLQSSVLDRKQKSVIPFMCCILQWKFMNVLTFYTWHRSYRYFI